jgi:amino acid permease
VGSFARLFIGILVIVGLALIAVGVVYFVVTAGSSPSFFPGHLVGSTAHRSKHGLVAVVVGAVVLVIAAILSAVGRRP